MYIIHGKLWTMEGQDYEDGYVEIRDGKIAALGDMRDCPASEEESLDVQGNVVMPGIIEAHCHMGITEEKKGMEGDDCNENVDPITPYLRAARPTHRPDGRESAGGHESSFRGKSEGKLLGPGYIPFHPHGHRRHAAGRADKSVRIQGAERKGKRAG